MMLGLYLLLGLYFSRSVAEDDSMTNFKAHQGRVPLHGNEWEQYERYLNLTAAMNSQETWSLWTDCVNELSRNGGSNDACTERCRERMKQRMKAHPLHNDKIRSKHQGKPDCNYDIIIGDHRIEGGSNSSMQSPVTLHVPNGAPFVTFNVIVGTCRSDDILTESEHIGGASFDITLASHYDLVSCVTEDRFHGTYLVVCPIHPLEKAHERANKGTRITSQGNRGQIKGQGEAAVVRRRVLEVSPTANSHLFTLTITLDFEHFDAFSDVFAPTNLLDVTLFRSSLQIVKNVRGTGANPNRDRTAGARGGGSEGKARLMGNLVREVANQEKDHTIYGHWTLDRETSSHGALSDFHWKGTGDAFMGSRKAFEAMFGAAPKETYGKAMSHLVGESHMRYYWDFFYYLYYGATALGQFDRKHGYSAHIPHLVHEGVLFATDMGDYFAGRECPPADSKAIYAFQFGTWDLTFASLRNLLTNSAHAMHLVGGIASFAAKCAKKRGASGPVHLVWVTPSPYPKCPKPECKDRRRFNNHYAIGAVTQVLKWKLELAIEAARSKKGGADSSPFTFETLDTRWIAATKMEKREYPCKNHLLCHPDGEVMQFSRPGMAVAGELLGTVVRHVTGKTSEELSERHSHDDTVLYIVEGNSDESSKRYYVLDSGILRKVPDLDTLQCLNQSASLSLPIRGPVSAAELQDYPLIGTPLPSRREATVLMGEFTPATSGDESNVWVMGADCSRKAAPAQKSSEAKLVMEMDLEDIPQSPQ